MKEFKGTKGKWLAKLENGRNAHDIIVDREDYAWVASVNQQFHDVATVEQAEANAKLIASAPELLEALQELVGHFAAFTPSEIESLNNAKQVINKALS